MYFKNFNDLKSYVESTSIKDTEQLMVLVGDRSDELVSGLMEYLNSKNINFFGGIFAGLIVGNKNRREGFIVEKVEPIYSSIVFPYMMRFNLDKELLRDSTALVLVDGLSDKMKDLTDTIYGKIGANTTYVGGGAGFYDLSHKPCIFNNRGIFTDSLYICIVKNKTTLAVAHGWKKLQGPFFVRKSYDNVLSELEYQNAFEVYKYVIEEEEGIILSKEDFFTYAKDHPFGILQDDGTTIIRDPITLNDANEIVCVASIPEESDVYVMKGDKDTLLSSSLQITESCKKDAPKEYLPLLFDCISRAMFLEERFEEELGNIQSELKYGVEGALSIGEIACKRDGEIVIHNKSTVLGIMTIA